MWSELFLVQLPELVNEILIAAIVVISGAMLLYSLSRKSQNRVTRTSSIVLAAVTVTFLGDVVISVGPSSRPSVEAWLRFQWIGIALVPAATFHLSDALLATTGQVSRWRRRLGVRLLYLLAAAFMFAAALTDQVVRTLTLTPAPHLRAGLLFPVFVFYAFSASALSVFNVYRARKRCLTFWTRRRMTYMLISILTPMVGVFPYTSVGTYSVADGPWFWFLVNLSNVAVIVMLSFMAYPLAFFGSEVPDRVIKAELLEFFLRGPFVGVATLSVIMGLPRAGEILGLPGRESMPLAAVASLIFLEWAVTRVLPVLKNWLIYQDDKAEIERLRELSERLLTHSDLEQLLEGILASACDYLRVPSAFVAASTADGPVLEQSVGMLPDSAVTPEALAGVVEALTLNGANGAHPADHVGNMIAREGFWLIPLWHEPNGEANGRTLFGVMGVHARTTPPALTPEEQEALQLWAERSARVLRDMRLQAELAGFLEGLMPQMEEIDRWRGVTRYRQEPYATPAQLVQSTEFANAVKDALNHYWGGPRLTDSRLLSLRVVQAEQAQSAVNAAQALRTVLLQAVESLRPEGERSMTAAEWTLYNILEMRYIQGRKVRDVARRLAMSESDFYRKQRVAINEAARALAEMEYNAQ